MIQLSGALAGFQPHQDPRRFGVSKCAARNGPRARISASTASTSDAFSATDLETLEITSKEPFARHVDGEPLEPATTASFSLVRDILKVRA